MLGKQTIALRHGSPKNFAYKGRLMAELVQALRHIGEANITETVEKRIAALFAKTPKNETIEHDMLLAPVWMRQIIKRNLKPEQNNSAK